MVSVIDVGRPDTQRKERGRRRDIRFDNAMRTSDIELREKRKKRAKKKKNDVNIHPSYFERVE